MHFTTSPNLHNEENSFWTQTIPALTQQKLKLKHKRLTPLGTRNSKLPSVEFTLRDTLLEHPPGFFKDRHTKFHKCSRQRLLRYQVAYLGNRSIVIVVHIRKRTTSPNEKPMRKRHVNMPSRTL